MSKEHPWRDEDTLRQKYLVEGYSSAELAELWGCSARTILNWCERHNIPRETVGDKNAEYRDGDVLEGLYWGREMSVAEIAEELSCGEATVMRWLRNNGIATRDAPKDMPVCYYTNSNGYEEIKHGGDQNCIQVRHHRLFALARGIITIEEFYDSNIHIHHKNTIEWDNREDNLVGLTKSEHNKLHADRQDHAENGNFV